MAFYRTYDYRCTNCNNEQEIFSNNHDEPKDCPKCGTIMTRMLTAPSFTISGVGAYASGCFPRSKEGPKIDPELSRLSDAELDRELGLDGKLTGYN